MTDTPFIDAETATRILHYSAGSSRHAWSALTSRLRCDDGYGWATLRLQWCFGVAVQDPAKIPIERLRSAKDETKQAITSATDADTQAAAWLCYAASVALAALHHNVRLSSMPAAAWVEVFAELTALLPEPWATVFERAIEVLVDGER
ncbi:MAG: hypothetical protein U0572_10625 [Phycisphaerales bacterium]